MELVAAAILALVVLIFGALCVLLVRVSQMWPFLKNTHDRLVRVEFFSEKALSRLDAD